MSTQIAGGRSLLPLSCRRRQMLEAEIDRALHGDGEAAIVAQSMIVRAYPDDGPVPGMALAGLPPILHAELAMLGADRCCGAPELGHELGQDRRLNEPPARP